MDILICPVCGNTLTDSGNTLKCEKGHCFDRSADGYVNLLTGHKNGDAVGDNREMARSRQSFLEKGYYACLRDAVKETLSDLLPHGGSVCDAGCGEGYYLKSVTEIPDVDAYGFDISKNMLRLAAKRKIPATLFVAGVNRIPLKDNSLDGLVSVFAPVDGDEFSRVLRDNGFLLCATAGKKHLWGLKQVLYEKPYENDERFSLPDGFTEERTVRVNTRIKVSSKEDISSLFAMTPYFYRTPYSGKERLAELDALETELDFVIRILRKTVVL